MHELPLFVSQLLLLVFTVFLGSPKWFVVTLKMSRVQHGSWCVKSLHFSLMVAFWCLEVEGCLLLFMGFQFGVFFAACKLSVGFFCVGMIHPPLLAMGRVAVHVVWC